MLSIAVVLIVLWLLGLITAYTMGGLLHILLVVAIVMIVINLFGRRRSDS
ncbi:lmo0937 family membrane protein [Rhodoferax sp. UBA5149]|nr:lmo0937 family membrane protein [Rhodoferax sp. UBA5149]